MRIALFNLDCLATNRAIRAFIAEHRNAIVFVGLSPPFRSQRGGFIRQSFRHFRRSGADFSNFLVGNFLMPRVFGSFPVSKGSKSATIEELCREFGITALPVADVNAPEIAARLRDLRVDLILSCYFDQIFRPAILAVPRLGAINVHTSLLPDHRGPMPVIHSALDEPPSLGVSVHRLEATIDTGPLLAQTAYTAPAGETVLRSMIALHARGLQLVSTMLPALERGEMAGEPQAAGTYEGFPTPLDIKKLSRRGTRLLDAQDMRKGLRIRAGT